MNSLFGCCLRAPSVQSCRAFISKQAGRQRYHGRNKIFEEVVEEERGRPAHGVGGYGHDDSER